MSNTLGIALPTPDKAVPPGFRRSPAGLIVPAEVSRAREVWTKQEWRDYERVIRLLKSRGVKVLLKCERDECSQPALEQMKNLDGSVTIRCGCKDRVFTRAF